MAHRRVIEGNCLEITDECGPTRLSIRETLGEQAQIVTMELSGSITMEFAHEFEDELTSVATVCNHIIIDFSGVDSISSVGLKALLSVQQLLDSRPSSMLKLRSLSAPIMKIFQELGFHELFDIES